MSGLATVYVIDDDEAVRASLERLIGSVGLKVQSFPGAAEFLSLCRGDGPGCLVLDVRMRGMSGLELQEKLPERGIELPVIFVTGHGDISMAVRAMKAGAFDFIEKPFNDQMLLDRIQQAIAHDEKNRRFRTQRQHILNNLNSLTSREREVLDLVLRGWANKEIAAKLEVSCRAVEARRAKLMERMQAQSVAELTRMICLVYPPETMPIPAGIAG